MGMVEYERAGSEAVNGARMSNRKFRRIVDGQMKCFLLLTRTATCLRVCIRQRSTKLRRFGRESELRRTQMESLRWLVDLAQRAGVERLVINGSFVTDERQPNGVDCVLLIGVGFPSNSAAESELLAGLPFLELSLVNQADFDLLVSVFFATDRHSIAKGMVEIVQ